PSAPMAPAVPETAPAQPTSTKPVTADPAPELTAEDCFTQAQTRRQQGDCASAVPFYRCAIERAPSEALSRVASRQVAQCGRRGRARARAHRHRRRATGRGEAADQ